MLKNGDRDRDDPANVYNITALLTDCPKQYWTQTQCIYTYQSG